MTTPVQSQSDDLRRVIGLAGGTALIVGITIGSGIFRTPPTIAGLVPNPLVIMGLWIGFGLVSICGALALEQVTPTDGDWPRNFTLDPTERWLLVANQRSGSIVVFARDPERGRLTPTRQRIALPSPVCLRFL